MRPANVVPAPLPPGRPWPWGRTLLCAFAGLILGGAAGFAHRGRAVASHPVEQPIAFNHRLHVQELEIECSTCHAFYETETFSGLPGADVCASCHEMAQGESAEEAKLVRLIAEGGALVWRPLFRQPAHVFFSHRRHVVGAGLECSACHGDIASTLAPPARVTTLGMQDCIDCHRRGSGTQMCTGCHR